MHWTEFETVFTDAWTDTSKKQNAYDQLMKLTLAGWDIDTYIATFKWLGWALDAKGEQDNVAITVLPPKLFVQSTTLSCLFSRARTLSAIDERVRAHQLEQQDLLSKWATTYPLTQSDGLHWYGDRLVVMEDSSLKRGVISLYHDSVTARHPGISNTMWAITWDFWWPMMKKDITEYVKGCTTCHSRKNQPNEPKPPLFPIASDTYDTPFTSIAMDFIVKLPLSESYDTILTIMNPSTPNTPPNFMLLTYSLITDFPTDHFGSRPSLHINLSKELCRTLGITQNISTAYHPQTDGQSERTNQRLEQYLHIFIDSHQQNWASLLPLAQYTINTWPNATTKKAPFELIMGQVPQVHQ